MHRRSNLMACLIISCCFVLLAGNCALAQEPEAAQNQPESEEKALTLVEAAILGVVEGLTEYLPVSSTGHLLLTGRILGIGASENASTEEIARTKEAADAYTIIIQIGAIIAVLGLYFSRVKQMMLGLVGKDAEGRQLLVNVVAGFLPAAVIGLIFNDWIKSYLFWYLASDRCLVRGWSGYSGC